MHYEVLRAGSTTRYKYTFEDNVSCVFSVDKIGIICFESKGKTSLKYLREALKEVSNIVLENGLTPKMNIKNSNKFLRELAATSGFKRTPTTGVSFSIWVRR